MSEKIVEQMVLNLSNPANEYGRNNLRDLVLVLHESGKTPDTIYNVLYMIGVDKQKAYEAIEMYIPKTKIEENTKMGLKEKLEASKEILNNLDKLSAEDDSLKKVAKELSEDITMMIGKEKAKLKNALDIKNTPSSISSIKEGFKLKMIPSKELREKIRLEVTEVLSEYPYRDYYSEFKVDRERFKEIQDGTQAWVDVCTDSILTLISQQQVEAVKDIDSMLVELWNFFALERDHHGKQRACGGIPSLS